MSRWVAALLVGGSRRVAPCRLPHLVGLGVRVTRSADPPADRLTATVAAVTAPLSMIMHGINLKIEALWDSGRGVARLLVALERAQREHRLPPTG